MFDFSKKYIRKDFLEFLENTLPSDIIFKEKKNIKLRIQIHL